MNCKNCWRCIEEIDAGILSMRMILCPDCGNKRCPKANDHRNTCTSSNEPGQKGSAYEFVPKIVAVLLFVFVLGFSVTAQECPPSMICLTQQQANTAAANARTVIAQDEKIKVLEEARKADAETIAELKKLNEQNVSDLKEVIKKTEIQLAQTNGQLIAREAEVVRQSAIIQAMLPMLRKKKIGLINIW